MVVVAGVRRIARTAPGCRNAIRTIRTGEGGRDRYGRAATERQLIGKERLMTTSTEQEKEKGRGWG